MLIDKNTRTRVCLGRRHPLKQQYPRKNNNTTTSTSSSSSSWIVSVFTIASAALVLCFLSDWHSSSTSTAKKSSRLFSSSSTTTTATSARRTPPIQRHLLELTDNNIDDDITRDDTCREYLMNFLNGTTDSKDECAAMSKAWQMGDCKDYKHGHGSSSGGNSNIDGGGMNGIWVTRFLSSFIVDTTTTNDDNNNNSTTTNSTDDDVMIDDAFEKWECCSSISDFYSKHCQDEHFDPFKLLGIVLVMVVCGLMKSMLRIANIQWIPDAGACVLVGAIVGGILRLAQSNLVTDKLLAFDNDLFMQVMLPPIVFEAAVSIDKRAFRRDLFAILSFAIVGTGFSAVAIAWITYSLSSLGGKDGLPFLDSLLFGSLMSSIDPVATLSILSSVGVSQGDTLYTLVFGESLLNDGVSIVLFESLVRHMGDADAVDRATVQDILANFAIVTLGSIGIGCFCGALCTLYFWILQGKQSAVSEVALFFAWALVPYYVADGLGLSGIISIMVMGFMLDYYVIGGHQSDEGEWMEYMELRGGPASGTGSHPVAPWLGRVKEACYKAFSGRGLILSRSRHHVGFVAEVISNIMETAIFAYLGLFLFNDRVWDVAMTFSGLFACVSSRAVMVILLSLLINACVWLDLEGLLRRLWRYCFQRTEITLRDDDDSLYGDTRNYLDCKTQIILISAGVRGAVSYALVQNVPVYDAVTKHGSHYKAELRSMTSATIVVILFVFGALTYFTVQRDLSSPLNSDGRGDGRVAGSLTHRLLSMSLASEDGANTNPNNEDTDLGATFEIEGHHGHMHHHRRRPRDHGEGQNPGTTPLLEHE